MWCVVYCVLYSRERNEEPLPLMKGDLSKAASRMIYGDELSSDANLK